MSVGDPFTHLGISSSASPLDIRRAWRIKARDAHPDTGGSHEAMQHLNQMLEAALAAVQTTSIVTNVFVGSRDVSSFTVAVLPVECFLALEVVAAMCGPTIADEPPYMIEFMLHDAEVSGALNGWCRCDLVPEAGATTVSLLVGSITHSEQPRVEQVRDYLVEALNTIDWPITG
jgi:hypothetical protein